MKTTTVNGTKVEIVSLSGGSLLVVNVTGRNSKAQVDSNDLIKPEGDLPPELAGLHFYDAEAADLAAAKLKEEE